MISGLTCGLVSALGAARLRFGAMSMKDGDVDLNGKVDFVVNGLAAEILDAIDLLNICSIKLGKRCEREKRWEERKEANEKKAIHNEYLAGRC